MVPIEMNGEIYLSASEASTFLGITRVTLTNYIRRGILRAYKRGYERTRYFRKADVEEVLRGRNTIQPIEGEDKQ